VGGWDLFDSSPAHPRRRSAACQCHWSPETSVLVSLATTTMAVRSLWQEAYFKEERAHAAHTCRFLLDRQPLPLGHDWLAGGVSAALVRCCAKPSP